MANTSATSKAGDRGGLKISRMPQIRHMKELVNFGATSNRRFRVVALTKRIGGSQRGTGKYNRRFGRR